MFKDFSLKAAQAKQDKQDLVIPIYSPRTSYCNIRNHDEALLVDLTLNFDPFTINILKNEFKVRTGVMKIVDFVLILKEHLLTWQKDLPFREKKLIRVLVMLFDEIDLNGNNLLEWDEFTNYIIEKATVLNSMKSKEEEVKNYSTVPFKLNRKFLNLLTKVIYVPDIDRLAMFEEFSDEIIFVNHESGTYNPKPLKVGPPKEVGLNHGIKLKEDSQGKPVVHAVKSMILDMIHLYDPKTKSYYLVTSSNDGALRVWKFNSNSFVNVNSEDREAIYTGESQTCMAWDVSTRTLYTGQRKGVINMWNFDALLAGADKPANETETSKPKKRDIDTDMDANDHSEPGETKDALLAGEIETSKPKKRDIKAKPVMNVPSKPMMNVRSKPVKAKDALLAGPEKPSKETESPKTTKRDINTKMDARAKSVKVKDALLAGADKPSNETESKTGKKDTNVEAKDGRERLVKPIGKLENGHSDVIMDIIPMSKVQMLATCSLDKTIILWSTEDNKKLRVYREHVKGVVSLAFNESLILLVSAGYDHQICVWNPYIDNPIFKITSHNFPLVNVKAIEGTQHFVSLDSSGTIKVWDFRKFNCLQSFSIENEDEKNRYRPQGFTYIPKPLKLALAGRNLFIFEYDKNYNPNSVDDVAVVNVCYRPQDNSIITPGGNKVKVWNALNGDVIKIFSDITTAEITAFALDSLKKRCLIGFSDGESAVFNITNGAKIKTLNKHQGEVNFIFEIQALNLIITCSSTDATIRMNSDTDINEAELKRSITLQDQIITSIAYKTQEKMLVVGTRNGPISFWEAETGKCIGKCMVYTEEITTICALQDMEYVIVGTAHGKISIIATPPSPFRFSKVYEFLNNDVESPFAPIYIQDMIWSEHLKTLFIADEKCLIKRLDLSGPIDEIYEHKKGKSKKISGDDRSILKEHLNPPVITSGSPPIKWISKGHNEAIKAIEYAESENLIFSAGLDKKVKVWDSTTGKYIDSLKYNKVEEVPIAYKKPVAEGILAPDMKTRVDKEFTSLPILEQEDILKKAKQAEKDKQKAAEENNAAPSVYRTTSKLEKNSRENSMKANLEAARKKMNTENAGAGGGATEREGSPTKKLSDHNRALEQWVINNNALEDKDKAVGELEKEVFDPFYNWEKIDLDKLPNKRSTQWKVEVNFGRNKEEFESIIDKIMKDIEKIEKEQFEKDGKNANNQQFKMTGFEVEEPVAPKVRAQTAADMFKKTQEDEKAPDQRQDELVRTSAGWNSNRISKPILRKEVDWTLKTKLKSPSNLYRTELKGKILDKNRPAISLSQDEVDAAYRLAAALSNYDKDDTRNLKFSDIRVKQQLAKNDAQKDWIGYNIQNLAEHGGSSSLKKGVLDLPPLLLKKSPLKSPTGKNFKWS